MCVDIMYGILTWVFPWLQRYNIDKFKDLINTIPMSANIMERQASHIPLYYDNDILYFNVNVNVFTEQKWWT